MTHYLVINRKTCPDRNQIYTDVVLFHIQISNTTCYVRAGGTSSNAFVPTTAALTKVMQDNHAQYSAVKWQYFGTEDGTAAFYPGNVADDCNNYDPRFRFDIKTVSHRRKKARPQFYIKSVAIATLIARYVPAVYLFVANYPKINPWV